MREPWMMFSKYQGQELIDNTNFKWTTINNVNGIKFINKTDSSKYIFLSPGGYWREKSLNRVDTGVEYGHYYSTTRYSYYAWYLYFTYGGANMFDGYSSDPKFCHYRDEGRLIRAVRPKSW